MSKVLQLRSHYDGGARLQFVPSWEEPADAIGCPTGCTAGTGTVTGSADAVTGNILGAPFQDIYVESGYADVNAVGLTVDLAYPFRDTSRGFVMLANNRRGNGGYYPANVNTAADSHDLGAHIEILSREQFTIHRDSTSTFGPCRAYWQSWEYTGPDGGPNEFIVRDHVIVTLDGINADTVTVSGISSIDRVIPFITGITSDQAADNADGMTAIAWMSGTDTLNVERGGTLGNIRVSVSVVEFTGSNWRVGHGWRQTPNDGDNIQLFEDSEGAAGATWDVNDWDHSIIVHQYCGNNLGGVDDAIADNSAVYYPGPDTDLVTFAFHADHSDAATAGNEGQHFVHVLEHPHMAVTRYSDTTSHTGQYNLDVTSAGLTNVEQAGVEVSRSSSGTGTAYSRGWVNARLQDSVTVGMWTNRSGNTIETRLQVYDFFGVYTNIGDLVAQESGSDTLAVEGNAGPSGTLAAQESGSDTAAFYETQANIAVDSMFGMGNINPATLTVDYTNPDEPEVLFTPYLDTWVDKYWGWAGRFTGMAGRKPFIQTPDSEAYYGIRPSKIYYSYDIDGPYIASTTNNGDQGDYHEWQFESAFIHDTVYIWQQVPTTFSVLDDLVDTVLNHQYGHRTVADIAYTTDPTPGVIATISSWSGSTWWGKTIPDLPLYSFRISDSTRSVEGGKRRCVIIAGQHAGEWTGVTQCRKFVEWLLDATPGGTTSQQAAWDLLGVMDFLIFPRTNPTGMYAGFHRTTAEMTNGQTGPNPYFDPNRDWYSAYFYTDANTAVRAAMAAEWPELKCNIAIDWHTANAQDLQFFTNGNAAACPEEEAIRAAARSYDTNVAASLTVNPISESFQGWMDDGYPYTGDFTVCPVAITLEPGTAENFSDAESESLVDAIGRALLDRFNAGDFDSLGVSDNFLSAQESGSDSAAMTGTVSSGLADILGDLAAQEAGSDTLTATGDVDIAGDLAATESGSDTMSTGGGVGVIGDLSSQESGSDSLTMSAGLLVAGDLLVQESGADSASLAGRVGVSGDLSAQEPGADSAALTGDLIVSGDFALSETGSDTLAVSGDLLVSGSLSVQESGSDSAALTGTAHATGDLAVQEAGSDTLSVAGDVLIDGSLAAQEAGVDSTTLTGDVLVSGDFAAQETGNGNLNFNGSAKVAGYVVLIETGVDDADLTGEVPVTGDLAVQESGGDAISIAGELPVDGNLAAQETGSDSLSVTGEAPVQGDLASQEAGTDTLSAAGDVPVDGTLAAQEGGPDAFSVAGSVVISGDLAVTGDGTDTISMAGDVLVAGDFAVQESGSDIAQLNGSNFVVGYILARGEGADSASLDGSVFVAGGFALTETGEDAAAITGTASATGSLSVQESGDDTVGLAGSVLVAGDLSAQDAGQDAAVVSGTVLVQGDFAAQDAGSDTALLNGSGFIVGNLNADETGADSAGLSGAVLVIGDLAAQDTGTDVAILSGSIPVAGDLAAQDAGVDTAALIGTASAAGDLAAQEVGSDSTAMAGAVVVAGDMAASGESADVAAFTGSVQGSGSLAAQESASDSIVIEGAVPVQGGVALQETGADTLAFVGASLNLGDFAAQEVGDDTARVMGSVPIIGDLAAIEAGSDVAALTGRIDVSGLFAAQESGADALTIVSGQVRLGDLILVESGDDTSTLTGSVLVRGDVGLLEYDEIHGTIARITGRIVVPGTLAAVEAGVDYLQIYDAAIGAIDIIELDASITQVSEFQLSLTRVSQLADLSITPLVMQDSSIRRVVNVNVEG